MGAGEIRDVGPFVSVTGYPDALELWDALATHFLRKRSIGVTGGMQVAVFPETTVGEALQVIGLFDARLAKAPPDTLGLTQTRARWTRFRADIEKAIAGKLLHETCPDNALVWRETRALAVMLSASRVLPRKADILLEALETAATSVADHAERLLDTSGELAARAADSAGAALRSIAGGAKDVVKGGVEGVGDAVIKPIVDAVGKPLLLGAGVVGALLIVPRLLDSSRGGGE